MLRIQTVCLAYIIFVQITASSRHGHFLLAKFWCKLSSCVFNKSFVMFPTFMILWRGGGGGYGWFQKQISCGLIWEKEKSCKEIPGGKVSCTEKKISLMVYRAEKKSYNVISRGKKFYLQRFGQKQFLHQPNHPYLLPPKKSNSWPIKLSL